MRSLVLMFAAVVSVYSLSAPVVAADVNLDRIYVGTYTGDGDDASRGIYVVDFDRETGQLSNARLAGETINPSFLALAPGNTRLYSVTETDEATATLVSWEVNPDGTLRKIGSSPTLGGAPCFVDILNGWIGVANYTGGNVALFRVDGSGMARHTSQLQFTGKSANPERQTAPHAHAFQFDRPGVQQPHRTSAALVADLGTDQIVSIRISSQGEMSINPNRTLTLPAGRGPRHFAYSPFSNHVLVIDELQSMISVLGDENGRLQILSEQSTLPADFEGGNSTAEILFHPSGNTVYGSNRGHDSLAVFRFDPKTGGLELMGHVKTGGKTPRNFRLSPDGRWLIAANQESNSIVVFRVGDDGMPVQTGSQISISKPVCIKFASETAEP